MQRGNYSQPFAEQPQANDWRLREELPVRLQYRGPGRGTGGGGGTAATTAAAAGIYIINISLLMIRS